MLFYFVATEKTISNCGSLCSNGLFKFVILVAAFLSKLIAKTDDRPGKKEKVQLVIPVDLEN